MRVLVFANGEMADSESIQGCVEAADLILCADGGAHHALALGLRPDVVIGDLDSLGEGQRDRLGRAGTRFISHPRSKDETDLELALLYAAEQGAMRITVLCARGGRIDHELGNLLLLVHPRLREIDVRLRSGPQEVRLVCDEAAFAGAPGDLLSLLPIGGDASGVTTSGLEYPLRDEMLRLGPARGISNVFAVDAPTVRVRSGLLLAVHTRGQGHVGPVSASASA
jgi:thiamine pyrophosphokinase